MTDFAPAASQKLPGRLFLGTQLAVMWEPHRGQRALLVDAQTVPQLEHVWHPDAGVTVPQA